MVFNLAWRPVRPAFAQVMGEPIVGDLGAAITKQNGMYEQPFSTWTGSRCRTRRPGREPACPRIAHAAERLAGRFVPHLCRSAARRGLPVRSTVPGAAGDDRRGGPDAGRAGHRAADLAESVGR